MANQRTLHSFLGIGSKKQRHDDDDDYDDGEGEKKRKAGESNNDGKVAAASKDDVAASATSNTKKKKSSLKSTSGSTTPSTNIHHHLYEQDRESAQDEIKRLHSQIITLQKQLDDATSRNNSIRNNQTLISTNLQRQLKNQKIEYDKLRDECNSKMEKAMDIVERFVRDESVRTSADLRQKLASDGARLGRLVSSRVSSNNHHGMMMRGRTQFIESWEDGYAPKRLKMKREELRMRREELERRKNELLLLDNNKNDNNGSGSINDESNSTITNVSDNNHDDESSELLTTMNDLDRMEAHETVRMHIDEIKRQEMELDNEEKVLNIEKRGHVRALKLLSNEDSSKFTVHRKVRLVFWYLCQKEY